MDNNKLKTYFEVFRDDNGELIIICNICKVTNLRISDVEYHLKSHENHEFAVPIPTNLSSQCGTGSSIKTESEIDQFVGEISNLCVVEIGEKHLNSDLRDIVNNEGPYPHEIWIKVKPDADSPDHDIDSIQDEMNQPTELLIDKLAFKRTHNRPFFPAFAQFKCDICGRCYTTRSRVSKHIRTVHSIHRPHKCDLCGNTFKRAEVLRNHISAHYNIKKHSCDECGKGFLRRFALVNHMRLHTGETFVCTFCDKRYSSKSGLRTHNLKYHIKSESDSLANAKKIPVTKDKLVKMALYNHHLPTFHQFKCDICDLISSRKASLLTHLQTVHSDHRPYICNICGNAFKLAEGLKNHIRRHSKIYRHTCDECGKGFIVASELRRHIMVHTGEKKCICTGCGKRFRNIGTLRKHELELHVKELKNKCDHPGCTRSFYGATDLIIHKRIHTGERPFSCNVCQKTFASPRNMKRHMDTHNPDIKYYCQFCPLKFAQSSTRRRHERRIHAVA